MMYAIAPLATDDPFEHVVGWKDDLILYDPDAFRKFESAFPEDTARMVNFGNPYAGDFSIEAVLENKADLLILDLGNLFKAQETRLIEKLDAAGVPVVFIDFRRDPTANAIPSMLLLGRLLEEETRAAEFIDFYVAEMRKVTNIVQSCPSMKSLWCSWKTRQAGTLNFAAPHSAATIMAALSNLQAGAITGLKNSLATVPKSALRD
jgi:iron complex transport system substrate-binding protein